MSTDFQKGLDTFDKNDYSAALREWIPLAEHEDAYVHSNLGVMYDIIPADSKIQSNVRRILLFCALE